MKKLEFVCGVQISANYVPFWDRNSPYYIEGINSILLSYYNLIKRKSVYKVFSDKKHRKEFGFEKKVKFFLDNGSFSFIKRSISIDPEEYLRFVRKLKPYWYPIPQDFIPHPNEDKNVQREKLIKTMEMNRRYYEHGCVPVIHAGIFLEEFIKELKDMDRDLKKIAIGGLVPHMLLSKNGSRNVVLTSLRHIRKEFPNAKIHVFGIGGVTTIHILKLLEIDSFDSIGWRVRAARGIIQLKGMGERQVAYLGSWKVPPISKKDKELLKKCKCPICSQSKQSLLKKNKSIGFEARAVHNVFVLKQEIDRINSFKSKKHYYKYIEQSLKSSYMKRIIYDIIELLNN